MRSKIGVIVRIGISYWLNAVIRNFRKSEYFRMDI